MTRSRLGHTAFVAMAVLAIILAVFSMRYMLPHPPQAPRNVMGNPFAWPWLPVHAALSSLALLLGPFQFVGDLHGKPGWHRMSGWVYVACCLLAAPVGLLLAAGATTGPVATAGFGVLAILWFATTALALKAARDGKFAIHRRWMIRSYALTFGAVTLRLYLAVAIATRIDFDTAYRAISFLAWVPNLLVAEWWLRHEGRGMAAAGG